MPVNDRQGKLKLEPGYAEGGVEGATVGTVLMAVRRVLARIHINVRADEPRPLVSVSLEEDQLMRMGRGRQEQLQHQQHQGNQVYALLGQFHGHHTTASGDIGKDSLWVDSTPCPRY